MKLIKPSFSIIEQKPGLEGIYEQIEIAGRTCYKSTRPEDKTAKDFVDMLISRGHGAMLEHGTVYLYFPWVCSGLAESKYYNNKYSKVIMFSTEVPEISSHIPIDYKKAGYYITTNYRVLIENNWLDDLKYLCEPIKFHTKRITVKFSLSRSIAQEFTRHRIFSFAMESQRYCNYSKNKFGNEITFIIPKWLPWDEQIIHYGDFEKSGSGSVDSQIFINSLLDSEKSYFNLLEEGWKPQQARDVLPNACKTELVMTGFIDDWEHFFELRCAENAHPDARALAMSLKEEFIKRGYINA